MHVYVDAKKAFDPIVITLQSEDEVQAVQSALVTSFNMPKGLGKIVENLWTKISVLRR